MSGALFQAFQFALTLALAPLVTGLVRKLKARLNGRIGPSPLQPYRDLWRLLQKQPTAAAFHEALAGGLHPGTLADWRLSAALACSGQFADAALALLRSTLYLPEDGERVHPVAPQRPRPAPLDREPPRDRRPPADVGRATQEAGFFVDADTAEGVT